MKLLMNISVLLFALYANAQSVGVNIDPKDVKEETTISIKKGPTHSLGGDCKTQFEITEGSDEIVADPAPLLKQARENWKKSCNDWKTEMKDMNKDNKVLALNCGNMECSTSSMETTCKSKATHKIKVKMTE